ncbi:MAG: ATP synthase F0 subunit C [Deltaproteobacteria bacterium RIFCSPHIGHO2_02_FULL_40_11]|nr:MAG: ATP synthase F0 subunit C [Deltaproteobacteria bacterium RIFCSPHIGHO2_02_FULL_40_11]
MLRKFMLGLFAFFATNLLTLSAFAENAQDGGSKGGAVVALAAGLAIALAAFGGALGQGKAAATALEGIARNPGASDKIFTPMIIGLALIESLVIYALVIAFMLVQKV